MNPRKIRLISTMIAILGAGIAVVAGFLVILWVFLIPPLTFWSYFVLVVATTLLALVGAVPGMVLGVLMSRKATSNETPGAPALPSEISTGRAGEGPYPAGLA